MAIQVGIPAVPAAGASRWRYKIPVLPLALVWPRVLATAGRARSPRQLSSFSSLQISLHLRIRTVLKVFCID